MTAIILQSRLDSTRLPQKALLDLAGKSVIVRVMENLRRISADAYVLACDADSYEVFAPLASSCEFQCISGPKEDVLERFCIVIRALKPTTILRSTGDNPYLFADAAEASLVRFAELQKGKHAADYFTYSGLPHGSGIEVFSAQSLLEAASRTDSVYDREHVGPSLYKYRDRFNCVFEKAPLKWYYPYLRTTIDTREDYERACLVAEHLRKKNVSLPSSTPSVIASSLFASRSLLFIPSVKRGQGTGHLRRLLDVISQINGEWRCLLYIPGDTEFASLIPSTLRSCVIDELPAHAHLVILDFFKSSDTEIEAFRKIGPVVAIDEGGTGRSGADWLFDILPSVPGVLCPANLSDPSFLPLPSMRREAEPAAIRTVLVVAGGENAQGLALPFSCMLSGLGFTVTVIDPEAALNADSYGSLTVSGLVPELREKLHQYDMIATHYGFTAFEALSAGCRVLLFSPTRYHYLLARAQGYTVCSPGRTTPKQVARLLSMGISVPSIVTPKTAQKNPADEITRLASRSVRPCPLCGNTSSSRIIARFPDRTVASCPDCGMEYISFLIAEQQHYSESYFFDQYQAQYGKTYLEDFSTIRAMGKKRLQRLLKALDASIKFPDGGSRKLLDIGCAFGPFLDAAREARWDVYGTDISEEAVRYVNGTLRIPAVVSAFPAPDTNGTLDAQRFTAVTLWYVIEHFEDLEPVFARIRGLLVPGGILAFSTPSVSGVSGRFNRDSFYRNSPNDHFTLWDPRKARKQLERCGFTVIRMVSTGHHCERFPGMRGKKPSSVSRKICAFLSRLFFLGDTFEVYAFKNGTMEDAQ